MNRVLYFMTQLLRNDLLGGPAVTPPEANDAFWKTLYDISARHDLAQMVAHALEKAGVSPGPEVAELFRKQNLFALYRYERLQYDWTRVRAVLEEAAIPFLPLKGTVLREMYPEPYLRTSCDVDLLIHANDLKRAETVLKNRLSFQRGVLTGHDLSMCSQAGSLFELHFLLVEENRVAEADKPLLEIWKWASPKTAGSAEQILNPAMLYYYHIAHMAKHIERGGCGIRFFLDLALLRRDLPPDPETKTALLAEGSLTRFERVCLELTDAWFADGDLTPAAKRLEKYIAEGGVYGNMQNRVAGHQPQKGGKARYLFSRIWLPFDKLCALYPSLSRHKFLMPFCQFRRWLCLVFTGRLTKGLREWRTVRKLSTESTAETEELFKDLGI